MEHVENKKEGQIRLQGERGVEVPSRSWEGATLLSEDI